MGDPALAAAQTNLIDLQNQIAVQKSIILDAQTKLSKLQSEAADLQSWVETWHRLAGKPLATTAAERMESTPVPERARRPKNPDRTFVVGEALEIIREAGAPVNRHDLYEALAARGVHIQGKDPEMVLSTMLWRESDKIVRLPPFGYWIKAQPYPPAGYDPEIEDLLGVAANRPEGGIEEDEAE